MQTVFSTAGLHPRNSFARWRDTLHDLGARLDQQRLDDRPFEATLQVSNVGPLVMSCPAHGPMRSETTASVIGRGTGEGCLNAFFWIAGGGTSNQDDRSSVQRRGDLVMIDRRPAVWTSNADSQFLTLQLPRERLESVLGPSRL